MTATTCQPVQNGPSASLAPVSVGAGLFALDRLLIGKDRVRANQQYAGGSCGNVTAILAFLGWNSYAIARLGTDRTARLLIDDLESCRVNTQFIARDAAGVTPVIVLRVTEDKNGFCRSKFEWRDPQSGDRLPQYRAMPKGYAKRIAPELPLAKIFYFDRAEPSSLVLATAMRENGAVTFFEPSSCKDDSLFVECLAVSDIVKYSADRIPQPPRNPISKSPRLEIQTLGAAGLRYRLKIATDVPGAWRELAPFPVRRLKDATGCGDWCSAGIITRLCTGGRNYFMSRPEVDIVNGIRFGQALAAVKCEYEGARGPMYRMRESELLERAESHLVQNPLSR